MLPTRQSMTQCVQLAIRHQGSIQLAGRCAYSARRILGEEEFRKVNESLSRKQGENNPEYHHAPRCYVENFKKHQEKQQQPGNVQTIRIRNPRYRWADFRRRMVYGMYDI